MSSKALYLSKVAPRLWHTQKIGRAIAIEVWTTTCIVMNFGKATDAKCTILINPANPDLSGVSSFPYFPRGGPVPTSRPAQFEHHVSIIDDHSSTIFTSRFDRARLKPSIVGVIFPSDTCRLWDTSPNGVAWKLGTVCYFLSLLWMA